MHRNAEQLLWFGGAEDGILRRLAAVSRALEGGGYDRAALARETLEQARRLLALAAEYGLDGDLWHGYLSYLLAADENPFSMACAFYGPCGGSLEALARDDLAAVLRLFDADFAPFREALGTETLDALRRYEAPAGSKAPDDSAGGRLVALCAALEGAGSADAALAALCAFYRANGAGPFALGHAFRVRSGPEGPRLLPIRRIDGVRFGDLVGCERQTRRLRENTEAFLRGAPANNMLLYGDSGTGKSSSVKALLNEYAGQGLRLVELYKHQLRELADVLALLKGRRCRFLVFIDDLSFEEDEVEYKFLKAAIEGGLEAAPENVLLCATSNRRHLIREVWGDRRDMEHDGDVHRSDTVEEKLSLAARFGVQIRYDAPGRELYERIVETLAARDGVHMEREELLARANRWELRHGGPSGRTARQFVNGLLGEESQLL